MAPRSKEEQILVRIEAQMKKLTKAFEKMTKKLDDIERTNRTVERKVRSIDESTKTGRGALIEFTDDERLVHEQSVSYGNPDEPELNVDFDEHGIPDSRFEEDST